MNRFARLLLTTALVPAIALPAMQASAQLLPLGELPVLGGAPQLLTLPVLNYDAGPAEIATQIATERGLLEAAQALLGPLGDTPAAAPIRQQIAQIEARIRVLELFADPLPELVLDAPVEALQQQLATLQTQRASFEAALIAARDAGETGAVAAVEARIAVLGDRIAQIEGAIAARAAVPPPAPEPAPAPAPEPVPAPAPAPEPAPAPAPEPVPAPQPEPAPVPPPQPAPEPAPQPVPAPQPEPVAPPVQEPPTPRPPVAGQPAPTPPAQPAAPTPEQVALDANIAAFVARELVALDLTADVAGLRAQLTAHESLRTEGEALLSAGRAAERDVTALAARMAEIQMRITQLTDEIARREGAAAEAPPPPDVIEQLIAGGDAAAAQNVLELRNTLLQDLLQIGAGLLVPQQPPAGQPPAGQPVPPFEPAPPPPPPVFGTIVGMEGERIVFLQGDQYQVRRTDTEELDRLLYQAERVDVQDLGNGFTRTTVFRTDGTQIVTLTDAYGRILERVRIEVDGRATILIAYEGPPPEAAPLPPTIPIVFEDTLPPFILTIPQDQYIIEADRVTWEEIAAALTAPPVEAVERAYLLDEIRFSQRLREKVRRIDLTTITFDFGSAAINPSQFDELAEIGRAIEAVLAIAPNSVFLIEGHADAVGTDYDNLILSDRRAETIAVALSTNFNIPSENLITQGYGEQFLKVPTLGPERQNRRGVILNITPLLFGAAAG